MGGYYGVAHGVANAILLPHVMDYNLIGNAQRFADIAKAMGEDTTGLTVMDAARLAPKSGQGAIEGHRHPRELQGAGRHQSTWVPNIVEDTFKSGNVAVNPVKVSPDDIRGIYRRAIG